MRGLQLSSGQDWSTTHVGLGFPKKRQLGPQNDSEILGPKKLPKIVICATIKETEKLKQIVVGYKWNKQVATNIHLDQSSPLRKQWSPLR